MASQMSRRSNISEREQQRRPFQRAMSIRAFGRNYGIGRTKIYEEINARRLRALKVGKRTLISADAAEDWLNALPAINESADEVGS
jgi:excisionase family DNA binding protein